MQYNLLKNSILCILCYFCTINTKAQEKAWYSPSKIGFLYGYGNQGVLFIKDKDYSYTTNLLKLQFYYPLRSRKFDLELIFEPTIGIATHQLLNKFFVQPFEPDYLTLREEFTKEKGLTEYILSTNLLLRRKIYKLHSVYALIGFGPMYISKRTERLAKGFAFSETISIGISANIHKEVYFDIRGGYRHLSNAELSQPNSGYNITAIEIGFNFKF